MPDIYSIQSSFQKGELSPRLNSRIDSQIYRQGAAKATNMQVMVQGGLRKRSGTRYVSKSIRHRTLNGSVLVPDDDPSGTRDADQTNSVLVDFVFSQQQSYVIEFGHKVMRFYTHGGRVITNPSEPDSRLHLAYEIAHPYSNIEINEIDYVQSADVMYFTHINHPVHKLIRRAETNWEINPVEFEGGPWMDLYTGQGNNLFPDKRPNPPNYYIPNVTAKSNQDGLRLFFLYSGRYGTNIGGYTGWNWELNGSGQPNPLDENGDPPAFTVTGIALRAKQRTGTDANDYAGNNHVTGWRVDGWSKDKQKWVQMFRRVKDAGYGNNEERAYFWPKKTTQPYTKHRWFVEGHQNFGGEMTGVRLQLSGVKDVTITFENIDGINRDEGFNNDDVGRLLRYRDGGGFWAIFKIVTVLNPTQIKGTLDAMQQLGAAVDWGSSTWQLGAFSEKSGYPSTCTIYQERLCLAATKEQPRSVFMSVSGDYENFFIPDPLTDDAPITVTLSGSRQDKINWMREMSDLMMVGTTDSIASVGGTNNEPLSPVNIIQRAQTWAGASEEVLPTRVGRSLFFVGTHGRNLHELSYTDLAAAFDAPPISQINEHLYRNVVRGMTFSHDVDALLMTYDEVGKAAWMTYEKVQNVIGACPLEFGGVDVFVLGIQVIPEDLDGYQGETFYMHNRRTVDGETVFYIERMEPPWEDQVEIDMWFSDCALRYDGPAVDQITGLFHLANETVVVSGWNETLGATSTDPTFSTETFVVNADGTLDLPSPMTRAVIGYAYEARLKLLPFFPGALGQSGSPLGRKVKADGLIVDMYRTRAILAKSKSDFLVEEELVQRQDQDLMDAYPPLFTGFKRVYMDDSWDEDGQIEIYSEQPFPMFIRSVTSIVDVEGK